MKITINDNININNNIFITNDIIINDSNFYLKIINKNNVYYQNTYIKFIYKVVQSSLINYYYKMYFCNNLSSCLTHKGTQQRRRDIFFNINSIIFFYAYFIHTKYCIKKHNTIYIEEIKLHGGFYKNHIIESITSKKLFNCRDYYRINSFI